MIVIKWNVVWEKGILDQNLVYSRSWMSICWTYTTALIIEGNWGEQAKKLCDITLLVKFCQNRLCTLSTLSSFTCSFIPFFSPHSCYPLLMLLLTWPQELFNQFLRMSLADGTVVRKAFHFVREFIDAIPTVPLWCKYLEASSTRGIGPLPCPKGWIFISQRQIH